MNHRSVFNAMKIEIFAVLLLVQSLLFSENSGRKNLEGANARSPLPSNTPLLRVATAEASLVSAKLGRQIVTHAELFLVGGFYAQMSIKLARIGESLPPPVKLFDPQYRARSLDSLSLSLS